MWLLRRKQNQTLLVRFVIHINPGSTATRDVGDKIKDVIIKSFRDSLFVINASSVFVKAREKIDIITTTPKQEQCLPVSLKECRAPPLNLSGYAYTSFPNIVGHRSAAEAQAAAEDPTKYGLLFETNCYAFSDDFYCSLLEPQCGLDGIAIPPCRQYCIAGVCLPVDVNHCSELGFNSTAFPNVLGQVTHDNEGAHGIQAVLTIFDATRCFKHTRTFVCGMHFPPCSGKPVPHHYIPPCRIMCEECPEKHVKCNDNKCIHSSWLCDGYQDCDDNSDENTCASCREGEMSCLPASGLCINESRGCDGRDDCYAGADETLCVRMDTDAEKNVLLVHNSVSSAWEEVCKEGWTREYSDMACKQLGYKRAITEAYVSVNNSLRHKSVIGALKNGSNPDRIQSYLKKGFSQCAQGYVVQVVCFEAVCGYRPAYFPSPARIVGGKEVKPGAWPWMASLNGGSGQKYFCGGTIIGPRWILTAGHCVGAARKEDGKSWFIKTGTTRRLAYSETGQVRHPANFFVHPDFNYAFINNDIALIQLDRPLDMNDFVRPICLPKKLPGRGVRCMVTGWGKNKDGALRYQPVLSEVGVDVTSTEYCRHAISRSHVNIPYKITDTMFCAGGSAGHDSCQGDSGGPLVCRMEAEIKESSWNFTTSENNVLEDLLDAEVEVADLSQLEERPIPYPKPQTEFINRWYQGGIVSWGVACGEANTPAVYTNLPVFLDWIEEVVRNVTGGSVLD
ncbi:atrial natriuretic peptide-converting enzyme [Elysia marginata]|uniref:Atrial natriuretic peptide-converting enzyme n=1 Tax=Elysia marginata TaxID=1093978 RepID=A0AAV4GA70_9GAST|nr:atrial natriuretic peptide-converting enzyme [Elysia marginata]